MCNLVISRSESQLLTLIECIYLVYNDNWYVLTPRNVFIDFLSIEFLIISVTFFCVFYDYSFLFVSIIFHDCFSLKWFFNHSF